MSEKRDQKTNPWRITREKESNFGSRTDPDQLKQGIRKQHALSWGGTEHSSSRRDEEEEEEEEKRKRQRKR